MYQKITIIGRLGQDPEMRYTPDGTPVTSFSVATDRRWTDGSGQQQQRTIWFRVSAWRRLAETASQYLTKGQLIFVEGELQEPRVFQGRDGEWRTSLEIRADNIKFLSPRGEGAPSGAGSPGGQASAPRDNTNVPDLNEEEIPF